MSSRKTKAKFAKRQAIRRLLDWVDNHAPQPRPKR